MACYNCIIRNPLSGYVLQVTDSRVVIDNFNGFAPQIWQVKPVGVGLNLIVNKSNGLALDIQGNPADSVPVITSPVRGQGGDSRQHWYLNSDKSIASAANVNLVLDVDKNSFKPGNFIIVYTKSGADNQKFTFECQ